MPNFTCNLTPAPCNMGPPAARHYHPTLSIWLSVDPMADKYPGVSPYVYCGNNPVRLVDPDGERIILNSLGRRETKKNMRKYFCEHFGTSKLFRFKLNGELTIRKTKFEEALSMANCEQELLLLGLRDAIMDNNNTAQIRISSDVCNELPMRLTLCTGQNPDGSQQLTTYEWGLPVGETGGGCTSPSEKAGCFFIGISDALSNNRGCTTGQYFKNEFGCIDILYTGSASSTFFHEVLDEFLNFYIRGNTTDQSPKINKVSFQNAALKNQGLPLRDGADHQ